MTTIELPMPVEEIVEIPDGLDDIPEMTAHLYWIGGDGIAACGVREHNDPHVLMHRGHGDTWGGPVPKGIRACPACGAPLCEVCFASNR